MKSTKITIPVTTFRKIDVPWAIGWYNMIIGAEDVDDNLVPFEFREIGSPITQQDFSKVKAENFVFMDWIVLFVKNVKYNKATNLVTFDYENPSIHWIIQGMDLLNYICFAQNKEKIFIKLELIEGIEDEDDVIDIKYARNVAHAR